MDEEKILGIAHHRVECANAVIQAIANHGPKLFHSEQYDLNGQFMLDSVLQGWWIDHLTGMKYEAYRAAGMYGSPERDIMQVLLAYIKNGKRIKLEQFDILAHLYDLAAMDAVRTEILQTGVIASSTANGEQHG